MEIKLELSKRFETSAAIDDVFDILADVPRSVSHYPDILSLEDLGDEVYKWTMQKLGVGGISHQVVYACRYASDAAKSEVSWSPIEGVGNGLIEGCWRLSTVAGGTSVDFQNVGRLQIPVPRILKSAAVPFVEAAFGKQVETYIAQLCETFSAL